MPRLNDFLIGNQFGHLSCNLSAKALECSARFAMDLGGETAKSAELLGIGQRVTNLLRTRAEPEKLHARGSASEVNGR